MSETAESEAATPADQNPVEQKPVEVALYDVTKRFGATTAVDGITIEIARGEFFSLLGPSGCGKTTSLRMIAGFEEPDEGRVVLAGNDITGVPPYKRNVNTVFQSVRAVPHLTVADNVGFGLRRKKSPKSRSPRRSATTSTSWSSTATKSAGRHSSPAASNNGWRWPARS